MAICADLIDAAPWRALRGELLHLLMVAFNKGRGAIRLAYLGACVRELRQCSVGESRSIRWIVRVDSAADPPAGIGEASRRRTSVNSGRPVAGQGTAVGAEGGCGEGNRAVSLAVAGQRDIAGRAIQGPTPGIQTERVEPVANDVKRLLSGRFSRPDSRRRRPRVQRAANTTCVCPGMKSDGRVVEYGRGGGARRRPRRGDVDAGAVERFGRTRDGRRGHRHDRLSPSPRPTRGRARPPPSSRVGRGRSRTPGAVWCSGLRFPAARGDTEWTTPRWKSAGTLAQRRCS